MNSNDLIESIKNATDANDILYALTKPGADEQVYDIALSESMRFPKSQDRILESIVYRTAMPSTLIKCTIGSSDTIISVVNSFHANDEVLEAAINGSIKFLPFSKARENILRAICKRTVSQDILTKVINVSKDSETIMAVINSPGATDQVFNSIIDVIDNISPSMSESRSAQANFLEAMLIKEKIFKAIINRTLSPVTLIRIMKLTGYADILLLAINSPAANDDVFENAINISKVFSPKIQSDILDYVTSLKSTLEENPEYDGSGAKKLK